MIDDLRHAVRLLLKRPGFTATALLLLSVGIGANTALFSLVEGVVLRPLPYLEPQRLVGVWETYPPAGYDKIEVSGLDLADWKAQSRVFERFAALQGASFTLAGDGEPERFLGACVSSEIFPLLGIAPALGRTHRPEEDAKGQDLVVVLGDRLWKRRFGADPHVLGRQISLNGKSRTVIGVMPPGFGFPEKAELWVPLPLTLAPASERLSHDIDVLGRLVQGATLEQAQAEIEAIARRIAQEHPEENTGIGARVIPLHEQLVGDVQPALLALLGAVGFVLLIACANIANLLLARAAARRKEFAVRSALGAGRLRLVRQLLIESGLLVLLGGLLGLLVAWWGGNALLALSPAELPRVEGIGLDAPTLLYTALLCLLTGLLFGLAPATQAFRIDLQSTLKEGGRTTGAGLPGRLRGGLVAAEVGLSTVLLVGAALLLQSLSGLLSVAPGFDPERVLSVRLNLPARYEKNEQISAFWDRALESARSLPGVESAALVSHMPMTDNNWETFALVEGRNVSSMTEIPVTRSSMISPGYFRTMGVPLLRGRDFTDRDTAGQPGVAIINQTMARKIFRGQDPLGQRFKQGRPQDPEPWLTIVGIVGDIHEHGLASDLTASVYRPSPQNPFSGVNLVLRSAGDPLKLAGDLRAKLRELDPEVPLAEVRTLESLVSASVSKQRFSTLLLGIFAAMALVLAVVGLYGVMSYGVAQRTHEIGIRMALGARMGNIVRLVLVQGMALALAGVLLGVAAGYGLTRFLSSLLYGISPTDPRTFGAIALLLSASALLACLVPARRASRVDPMVALREE
jgi:putative ABC transport system permease protein